MVPGIKVHAVDTLTTSMTLGYMLLEAIDIILGLQIPTDCQLGNGDVPNGMPPYCGNPPGTPNCEGDGDIDIFDVLVMIDKALGKANCCDYCLFGNIY